MRNIHLATGLLLLFTTAFGCQRALAQRESTLIGKEPASDWGKLYSGFRAEAGWQKSFYAALGFSLQKPVLLAHGIRSYTCHVSGLVIPASFSRPALGGAAIGAEMDANGFFAGADLKYLANSQTGVPLLVLKTGFGAPNLFLQYGITVGNLTGLDRQVGRHQVSLVCYGNRYARNRLRKTFPNRRGNSAD